MRTLWFFFGFFWKQPFVQVVPTYTLVIVFDANWLKQYPARKKIIWPTSLNYVVCIAWASGVEHDAAGQLVRETRQLPQSLALSLGVESDQSYTGHKWIRRLGLQARLVPSALCTHCDVDGLNALRANRLKSSSCSNEGSLRAVANQYATKDRLSQGRRSATLILVIWTNSPRIRSGNCTTTTTTST